VNAALLDAYRRTTFIANTPDGRISLRIGQRCSELDDLLVKHGVTTWAYVTAFNPGSKILPREDNLGRHRKLEQLLASQGFAAFGGEGIGDDDQWPPEASLLVLGIERADAIRVGQEFGQFAIVCGDVGQQAELIICDRTGSAGFGI